jgi:predicted extracellular nuclease
MKKKLLALAIGSVLSAGAQAAVTDIIISEYVEATDSKNSAIEIKNTHATDAFTFDDKTQLVILGSGKYVNPLKKADATNLLTGSTIAAGETLTVITSSATSLITDALTLNSGASIIAAGTGNHDDLYLNGDDSVYIADYTDPSNPVILDIVGTQVEYAKWGENQTLSRFLLPDGSKPSQSVTYESTEWLKSSVDTVTGLGSAVLDDYEDVTIVPAVPLTMIPADEGSFKAMLKRFVGKEVIINADIDPNTDGEQGLVITRSYGFTPNGYVHNMSASYKHANIQPNQIFDAGSAFSVNQENQNRNNTLIIDTTMPRIDGEIAYYPTFHTDAANNPIRINDKIKTIQGFIVDGDFGFQLNVTQDIDSSNFDQEERPATPALNIDVADGHFAIKIATQNVLNLFNSPFGGADNLHGGSRGAVTEGEYIHQTAKLVEAIYGLDADIVGLMEIENNGFSDTGTIAAFVEAINLKYHNPRGEDKKEPTSAINKYAFIGFDSNGDTVLDDLDSIGSDVITSGIIYRPLKVSIVSTKIIPMPQQHAPVTRDYKGDIVIDDHGDVLESGDNYQRDTVTATFVINQTGKRLTVAVNHFKSKGSTCHEDWQGVDFSADHFNYKGQYDNGNGKDDAPDPDFQGQCENFRVAAAVQLGDELDKIGGDRVVMGDMNSYAKEDPILVLTKNPNNKVIKTARDTFIGKVPQFVEPVTVEKTFGYMSAFDADALTYATDGSLLDKELAWSYAYDGSIGSLDHILITPSLNTRVIDAKDWHINAAESVYYDYSTYRADATKGTPYSKGANGSTNFVVDDAYRSSDHDPAIMSLEYKYGEVSDGQPVHLVISSGSANFPYSIPVAASVKAGDIAEISLSSESDMSEIELSTVTVTQDGQSVVNMEVYGIKAGNYNATMTLVRDGTLMPEQTQSMKVEVAKTDSLTPKLVVPENDGTGGSFGIFGILSLLGLGFLRRTKA